MQMRPRLKEVRTARTALDQQRLWAALKRDFSSATSYIRYIENRWLSENIERWAAYHRVDGQEVTTNNWVESWHKTLKQRYLGHKRNVRADYLIWLLEDEVVNTDFFIVYFKIKRGLAPPPMTKEDKLRKSRAGALPIELALASVTPLLDENVIIVRSFSLSIVQYNVSVKPTNGLITNELEGLFQTCTCPDHRRCQRPCKHMYLIDRPFPYFLIDYYLQAEQVDKRWLGAHSSKSQAQTGEYALYDWIPLVVKPGTLCPKSENTRSRRAQTVSP